MSIGIISISHKTAPVHIRALLSFNQEEQRDFIKEAVDSKIVDECVLISTCNRTEVCFSSKSENINYTIDSIQKFLASTKNIEMKILMKHFRVFTDRAAITHLFRVACGIDSMVIGEDEILGQVKQAFNTSKEVNCTSTIFNVLFREAITNAKIIKTQTLLSKIPVSIGTFAANAALDFIEKSEDKVIMIIGASGKIGGTVLKNLCNCKANKIIVTTRNHNSFKDTCIKYPFIEMINYEERYKFIDRADVVISATSSPHYTLTKEEVEERFITLKDRLFIDLAVPTDIDGRISTIENSTLYNIDYFNKLSKENNARKLKELEAADIIINDGVDNFEKWLIFREFMGDMDKISKVFKDHSIENIIYSIRDNSSKEELETFIKCISRAVEDFQ
ncbi:glutamyl-tRNA reductase [Clostridium cellulovorans]|uniref:Glutamyl-tRNA reductase n=1 Tax=Clostridium cellulovorans (strain ATCC 35296 / DSM 3052 / OCM 3 / 743B) TaxID=573061 RepID=D9SNY4_CLOC7|nr:glutamyl-tRNA reductase [Clostridium cellulovorans]ADL51949.1 glutamyl-tRNA reductase [Clostridium cellulovorans 743B]